MTHSYEILKKAITPCGAKAIAAEMNLSQSMIYKWCQPSGDPDSSGADNPLDRLLNICELTGDDAVVDWLCQQTDSFRVKNPPVECSPDIGESVLNNTQEILKEFAEVLDAVTKSYANGQQIDMEESEEIRKEWDELKSRAEQFVYACERGLFLRSN